jgi:hypothetical protein
MNYRGRGLLDGFNGIHGRLGLCAWPPASLK